MSFFWSRIFRAFVPAAIAFLVFANPQSGSAQQSIPRLSVKAFSDTPSLVLQQYPTGGPGLVAQIRDLAMADPTSLGKIIGLLGTANKTQKAAIAAGLSQAAKLVVFVNQPYATAIAEAVTKTKDEDVIFAYTTDYGTAGIGRGQGVGGASSSPKLSVKDFLANPNLVLQQNPNGGPDMIALIRDLAVADPQTLDKIIGLVEGANKLQKGAIGSALSQAAKAVILTNQPYATTIAEAVAKTKDEDVVFAYTTDYGTAGIGEGVASAGASGGPTNAPPNGGSNGSNAPSSTSTPTAANATTGGGVGGGGGGSSIAGSTSP